MKIFISIILFLFLTATSSFNPTTAAESKEDAVALVKKATAYYKANGAEKAFAEFSNEKGQFSKGNLYILVYDLNGKSLAHGRNPRLIGKNLIELRDVDGSPLIKNMVDLAKTKGSGWIDYKWPNPINQKVEAKTTYVERVDDILIACGIYKK